MDKDFIKAKLAKIRDYLSEVENILNLPEKDILASLEKVRMLERNFQLIVDVTLDINIHIIRELNLGSFDDYQSTFYILAEGEVLSSDFARKIAPTVGLRNALVHGYEKVDKERFVRSFIKNRDDFNVYFNYINELIKK